MAADRALSAPKPFQRENRPCLSHDLSFAIKRKWKKIFLLIAVLHIATLLETKRERNVGSLGNSSAQLRRALYFANA